MTNLNDFIFLVIAGPSGSGKTTLADSLVENYPSRFYKVKQVTTREMRDDEKASTYVWMRKRDFKGINHLLFAHTNINGEYYGSIPPTNDKIYKCGIIILNEEGFNNFKKDVLRENYFSIGLNLPFNNLNKREERTQEYVENEYKVLEMCDQVLTPRFGKFVEPVEVIEIMEDYYESIKK